MRFKGIWEALSAGKKITDGQRILSYKDKLLVDEQGEALDLIPFNADNCDEWVVYDEEATQQPLYYRWVRIGEDFIRFSETFYLDSVTPSEGWKRHADGFTKEEIIGSLG